MDELQRKPTHACMRLVLSIPKLLDERLLVSSPCFGDRGIAIALATACFLMGVAVKADAQGETGQSATTSSTSTAPKAGEKPTEQGVEKDASKAPPSAPSQPAAQTQPPAETPKSLDELLGTAPESTSGKATTADDIAAREQARRLEKALEGASMQDLVTRAVDGMRTAADLLGESKDTGLGTQRTQEEVIRALDRLLEEAKRQERKQKGSKSSSSKSGKQQKPSQDPSEQNGQQSKPQQEQKSASQRQQSSDSTGDSPNSGTRSDDAGTMGEIMETRVEWGQLPERIRELVLQGRRDRVSSMYERLTREYYRRLAEEASK